MTAAAAESLQRPTTHGVEDEIAPACRNGPSAAKSWRCVPIDLHHASNLER